MMDRARLIEQVGVLAGPLGPFTSIEQREAEQRQWHASLSQRDAATLADLLYRPPSSEQRGGATAEHFELETVEALIAIGRLDPAWFGRFAAEQLSQRGPASGLIEALGAVGGDGAASILIGMSDRYRLSRTELMALVCALGEIGGEQAQAHLAAIQRRLDPKLDAQLIDEIAMAQDNAASG
jgi:hypothetical protein